MFMIAKGQSASLVSQVVGICGELRSRNRPYGSDGVDVPRYSGGPNRKSIQVPRRGIEQTMSYVPRRLPTTRQSHDYSRDRFLTGTQTGEDLLDDANLTQN